MKRALREGPKLHVLSSRTRETLCGLSVLMIAADHLLQPRQVRRLTIYERERACKTCLEKANAQAAGGGAQ